MSRISEQGWNQIMACIKAGIETVQAEENSPFDAQGNVKPEWSARLEVINEGLKNHCVEIVLHSSREACVYERGEEYCRFQIPVEFLEDSESAIKITLAMVDAYHLGRSRGDDRGYARGCANTLRNIRNALGLGIPSEY